MDRLHINLLGGFAIAVNQQPVTKFRSAKARALLAYLATQPAGDHARTTLATLLWEDLPERTAKTNLRIELSNLHKMLGNHPALIIERHSVRFCHECATVDVRDFQGALATFAALPIETQQTQLGRLQAAVERYQGEFLNGFTLSDAPAFDEWRVTMQEQLHEQLMNALNLLQEQYAGQGCWAEVAAAARWQLTLVPWQESAHRNLMQALAAQGQRSAALAQFARCMALLQAELGVEPERATQEMADRLRRNGGEERGTLQPLSRHNLPQQTKMLVGRKTEIEQVYAVVQQERLVTLLGLGGVGKSHLALAVARKALPDFADGVWFVSLTQIEASDSAPDRIALAMAAAIGFPLANVQQPLAELAAHLADKELLFILDNWDHLTAAAELLCEQLLATQAVHMLATSRVRLQVEGETVVPLTGLPTQAAFALFVERARQVVPAFAVKAQRAEINNFCMQVAGLPLGIELAASWVEHFTIAEISHSLTEIVIEPTQAARYVNRHQTLDGLFEYSWRLLSPTHQQLLAQLSAFRGGFDRVAAGAVAGSTLSDLSVLLAHSLVQRVSAGRYDLHPLVQELAADKLATDPSPLFGAHASYYLTLLTRAENAQYVALRVDLANIRSAWQCAVLANNSRLIQMSTEPFGEFIIRFGLMIDGNELFAQAVEQFEGQPAAQELVARLLAQQVRFLRGLHGLRAIRPLQQRILRLTKNPKLQTVAHVELANDYAEQGEWAEADCHFDQAEGLVQASADLGLYIRTVERRIHINTIHFRGDFAHGIARLEEFLQLIDSAVPPISEAETLRFRLRLSLPMIAIRYCDYGLAIRYARQVLLAAQQIAHRNDECCSLIQLALAEQFAGLYPQAVVHSEAALAIAEEIGNADEIALLQAILCLTLRQQGELGAALAHGQAAIAGLCRLGNRRVEGQARNRVGHTLLALERWAEAEQMYTEALAIWAPTQHPNRYEAVAGRAVALYRLGHHQTAVDLVQEVLIFFATADLVGIVEPVLLLLNCATVLTGCGEERAAQQTLQRAANWVEMVADRSSDDTARTAFLAKPDVQQVQRRLYKVACAAPHSAYSSERSPFSDPIQFTRTKMITRTKMVG